MKTAIVYHSMSGKPKYAVDKIADGIKASEDVDIIKIRPEKAYPDKGFKKFFRGGKSAVMSEKPKLSPYEFDRISCIPQLPYETVGLLLVFSFCHILCSFTIK